MSTDIDHHHPQRAFDIMSRHITTKLIWRALQLRMTPYCYIARRQKSLNVSSCFSLPFHHDGFSLTHRQWINLRLCIHSTVLWHSIMWVINFFISYISMNFVCVFFILFLWTQTQFDLYVDVWEESCWCSI